MRRLILVTTAALAIVLLGACSGDGDDSAARSVSTATSTEAPTTIAEDFTDEEKLCMHFMQGVPLADATMQFGWARINTTPTGEEVLALGWTTGVFHSEQEATERRVNHFYAALPAVSEVVTALPGIDVVVVVLLGSNFEASITKTIFRLPADVVADYRDTPEGRNVIQAAVTFLELPILPELYGPGTGVNEPQASCG